MTASAKQFEMPGPLALQPKKVYWGCHDSPLGPLLLGVSEDGLCKLELASGYGLTYDLSQWQEEWPETEFVADSRKTALLASRFSQMPTNPMNLAQSALYGPNFQLKIWKTMLQIEPGQSVSYAEVTALMGKK
jgi:AraC family transcriptional regulator of adaptative response/methylated-DNA-[protein]-cysteine methyltransferase